MSGPTLLQQLLAAGLSENAAAALAHATQHHIAHAEAAQVQRHMLL